MARTRMIQAFVFFFLIVLAVVVAFREKLPQRHGKMAGFSPGIFLPIVLCIVLLSEIVAIDRARRAVEDPAPVTKPANERSRAAERR